MKNILAHIITGLFALLSVMLGALVISTIGVDPLIALSASAVGALLLSLGTFLGWIPRGAWVTVCGEISNNISISCDNPIQAGTRERGIIINFEDIVSRVYATDGYTVEDIVLASGKTGYVIEGQNNSIEPKATMVKQGFNKMWDHEVMMKGFDISPETKNQVNAMKDGRFTIITENYFQGVGGNTAFEVFGLTVGLEVTELERDNNSVETQGAFHFKFFTDVNKEPKSPNTFYKTDYTTTKALVDALLV